MAPAKHSTAARKPIQISKPNSQFALDSPRQFPVNRSPMPCTVFHHRQPEGRRRQDHDGDQSRRGAGGTENPHPRRGPRPAANATSALGVEKFEGKSLYGPLRGEGSAFEMLTPNRVAAPRLDSVRGRLGGHRDRTGPATQLPHAPALGARTAAQFRRLPRHHHRLPAGARHALDELARRRRPPADRSAVRIHGARGPRPDPEGRRPAQERRRQPPPSTSAASS